MSRGRARRFKGPVKRVRTLWRIRLPKQYQNRNGVVRQQTNRCVPNQTKPNPASSFV